MGPWLAIAGVAVLAARRRRRSSRALRRRASASTTTIRRPRPRAAASGVGWLLLAPDRRAAAGRAADARQLRRRPRRARRRPRRRTRLRRRCPRGAAPVPMTLLEFGQRAFDHNGASFNGATVQPHRLRRRRDKAAGSSSPATRSRAARPTRSPSSCTSSEPPATAPGGTSGSPSPASSARAATARSRDLVATSVVALPAPEGPLRVASSAARPGGAEEPAGLGLHEAHALVHLLERRLASPRRAFSAPTASRRCSSRSSARSPRSAPGSGRGARRPTRRRLPSSRRSRSRRSGVSSASIGSPVATHMISSRFETPGFVVRVVADLALGVGHRRLELLADRVRRRRACRRRPAREDVVVDILFVGSWRSMIRPPISG